jgi:hypothetical protein
MSSNPILDRLIKNLPRKEPVNYAIDTAILLGGPSHGLLVGIPRGLDCYVIATMNREMRWEDCEPRGLIRNVTYARQPITWKGYVIFASETLENTEREPLLSVLRATDIYRSLK